MGNDLKNRREFLGKIRDWLVGGLYAMIPLTLFSRGGTRHIFEIDTEKGSRPLQAVTCNCKANQAISEIARNQGELEPDHTGCACVSMDKKAATRAKSVPMQCSCTGQWARAEAHEAANDN